MAGLSTVFDRRSMMEALEEMREPTTFFVKKFFQNVREFNTKYVDVDIFKGKRRVAAYVSRRAQGQKVDRIGYKTYAYEPPYQKPKMITTADDLLTRMPGEVLYADGKGPEQRAREQMAKDLAELESMIARAEELQAVQALFDASVEIKDEDGNEVVADITFPRDSDLTIDLTATGETAWDATGSNKIKNLRDWRKLCIQKSGVSSNIAVLGSDAADEFLDDSAIQALLDNRRIEIGNISLQEEAQELGVTYLGRIAGFDLYQVDEWYIPLGSSTESALVSEKKVLIGSTFARCDRLYGAIEDVEIGVAAMARYPKTWLENDPSARILQLHSAPLLVPTQVDAFLVATVLE